MANLENTTPLWLDLKIEYIDENFNKVKDYLKKYINIPNKDSFYYTTIDLLNKRIAKLIQDEYEKNIGLDDDTNSLNIELDIKLLTLYLLISNNKSELYNSAFLLFIDKIIKSTPKLFNDSFIENLITLDFQRIDISKILTWSDFDLFSCDIIAHKLVNYNLPQIKESSNFSNKGFYNKTSSGLEIYPTKKIFNSLNKVSNFPLFNNKLKLFTCKEDRIGQSDSLNTVSLEEFTLNFINKQQSDTKPSLKNYNEGDICEVKITKIGFEIEVETIDNDYNRIVGVIDFSNKFWNYYDTDFKNYFKENNHINVKYLGNNKFDIKETFENYIINYFDNDYNSDDEIIAEVIFIDINTKKITWGTDYGFTAYSDELSDINMGDRAFIRVTKGWRTGFFNAEFIESTDEYYKYNESKELAIKEFIITEENLPITNSNINQISKEEIKILYSILISYQYHCVNSPILKYQILCVSLIMAQLIEREIDSEYIKFLLDYLKNLIFFVKDNYAEMQVPTFDKYNTPLINKRKCIIEILKLYGSDSNIDLSSISETEPTLFEIATMVESCNRLDNIITKPMQNFIKREILKKLSISTEGEADLDEVNGEYLGIEDNTKEFKTSFFHAPTNAKEQTQKLNIFRGICAFLNTQEGGTLYLGVNDSGYVKGIEPDLKHLNSIIPGYGNQGVDGFCRYITDELTKFFDIDVVERIKIDSLYNNNVIAIKVQPYEFGVVTLQDKTYLRVNSESRDISSNANAIKHIEQRKLQLIQNKDEDTQKMRELKSKITKAQKSKKQAILHNYCSSNSGSNKNRNVEIFEYEQDHQSIWCFDIDNKEVRLFKLSRIGDISITEKPWQHEKLHNKLNIDIFHMTGNKPIDISLRLNLRAKNLLIEEYPESKDDLTPEKNSNTWLLNTTIYSIIGLARFYMGLINDIEIITAPGLKEYIQNFASTINEKLKEIY